MPTQTVEATYLNGKIKFNEKINATNAKLYIIAISDEISTSSNCKAITGSKEFLGSKLHTKGQKLLSKI